MTIRFHLDEHVHAAVSVGLRSRGIDVTTTVDADLRGASDQQRLAFALAQNRVLVTHDTDFLSYHAKGVEHSGIAYCHRNKYSVGELLQMLLLLHACDTAEQMRGNVQYL